MSRTISIGTRGSLLARTQSSHVQDMLSDQQISSKLTFITTPGDRSDEPIAHIGVGVFTSTLRTALLSGEVDIAVHSYKDLPTASVPGITLAAIPPRVDPRDAVISRDNLTLAELPPGSVIGTSAPRRIAQLAAAYPHLKVKPLRGNLDTRIHKVNSGELDAIICAYAGLIRLGKESLATQILNYHTMMPAPGQGALAIECRSDDIQMQEIMMGINHPISRYCVEAERALLATLEAGCTAPIGAYAVPTYSLASTPSAGSWSAETPTCQESQQELCLQAVVCALDGSRILTGSITGMMEYASRLGRELADTLFHEGAQQVLSSAKTL